MLRRHQRTSAGGSSEWRLYFANGTFSRTAEASYQTGAPTDGSSPFLAWASANTPVYENLGDGGGALLRIEGARTNVVLQNRDVSHATWSTTGGTRTANDVTAPDGGTTAARLQTASGEQASYQGTYASGGKDIISAWMRSHSGTAGSGVLSADFGSTSGVAVANAGSLTTVWVRLVTAVLGSGNYYAKCQNSTDTSSIGGQAAQANDCCFDLVQWESGKRFPSSAIRTTTTSVTRDADVLTFTSAQLPAALFTSAAKFLQVSPEFGDADLDEGETHVLLGSDALDGIVIEKLSGVVYVSALQGGTRKASSGALTFGRNALLGVVRWDPVAAVITVNGAAGAAGTPWSWTPATMRIGGLPSGGGDAFCRFGTLMSG